MATRSFQVQGLCYSSDTKLKEEFLGRWQTYLKKLERIEAEVTRKTAAGYSLENRMPTQLELLTLSQECQDLSNEWYGSDNSNLSCFYLFFYRVCESAQITFYPYDSLVFKQHIAGNLGAGKVSALIKSADGFVSILDAGEKEKLERKEYREKILNPYLREGGLWAGGRSAIDNTILTSVFSEGKGLALVQKLGLQKAVLKFYKKVYEKRNPGKQLTDWGQLPASLKIKLWDMIIQKPLLNCIQIKQKALLFQLSQLCQVFQFSEASLVKLSSTLETEKPDIVIKCLNEIATKENEKILAERKIDKEQILFKLLMRFGKPLTDLEWPNLSQAEKDELLLLTDEALDSPIATTIAGQFAKFSKSNPGEYFTASNRPNKPTIASQSSSTQGLYHWWVQTQGLEKGHLRKFKRSKIENLSPIRYWPKSWVRRFPLENIIGGKRVIIRAKQSQETSRFRINQGPYQPAHCLSMASSGLPEGLKAHNTPVYNLGIALDPFAATVSNQHCDIEKCLTEASFLNPRKNVALPGEAYLTVGANSYAGSSIKQTQHNQISQGVLADFPIYLHSRNVKLAFDNKIGLFELVSLGKSPDTFFLKITTDNPSSDEVISCLIDLKMQLLEKFGGTEKIDFHFHVIPDGKGMFTIIFAPLAPLIKQFDLRYKSDVFFNPDLQLCHRELGLPVEHIHLAHANGLWGLYCDKEKAMIEAIRHKGRETLETLWDFTAKKGALECVTDFLKKRIVKISIM